MCTYLDAYILFIGDNVSFQLCIQSLVYKKGEHWVLFFFFFFFFLLLVLLRYI